MIEQNSAAVALSTAFRFVMIQLRLTSNLTCQIWYDIFIMYSSTIFADTIFSDYRIKLDK